MTAPRSASSAARTGILVVSYGSAALLRTTLANSVPPEPGGPSRAPTAVVVVENHRDPAQQASTRALCVAHGWEYLEPGANLGFGGGCNLAADRALALGCDALVLLNPDLTIPPDGVARLAARVRSERDVAVAPLIHRPDGSSYSRGRILLRLDRGEMLSERRREEVPNGVAVMTWLTAAALALSSDLWRRSGGFDPRYFLYWEDVDLSRRIHRAGVGWRWRSRLSRSTTRVPPTAAPP